MAKETQRQIIDAYERGDQREVNNLQMKLMSSYGARALAVRKVTTNKGGKTSGLDGII